MITLDVPQRTHEWYTARLGCVTSSRVAAAISSMTRKLKEKKVGDETAARENLRLELMGEILTKEPSEHYVSQWMRDGIEREPFAIAEYSIATGRDVRPVGYVFHPTIKLAGASPDGVTDGGIVEAKCPKEETHIRYLINGVVPREYRAQMYWQMACTGGECRWNDFVSYHPRMPERLQLFIVRLPWDDKIIADMEEKVVMFNAEVEESMLKLDPEYLARQLKASIRRTRKVEDAGDLGVQVADWLEGEL